ncbi:MAG: PEGA domain-containing protein, partial [Candidatus Heimdallarchaeaceae archaeon]
VKGRIYLDGKDIGVAPQEVTVLEGMHTIVFDKVEGYEEPSSITFTIKAKEVKEITGEYKAIEKPPIVEEVAPAVPEKPPLLEEAPTVPEEAKVSLLPVIAVAGLLATGLFVVSRKG